jgi:predicted DNA binding CopG/RHH family protein
MIKNQRKSKVTRERVLTVRVDFDQLDTLKRTARSKGTTVSTLIRDALTTAASVDRK